MKFIVALVGLLTPLVSFAADSAEGVQPNPMGQWIMLLGFGVVFYFFLWRPQSQRQKAHQQLVAGLEKGDEVVSSGGLVGKISKVNDSFVTLEVANGVEIRVQKQAVSTVLPKGTIASA